ncbi:glycosyltransferase [Gordonia sp. (in: high G+C Gram-positive bacteria)]|uniref:glycosyltransferase family 2 protein n=1 Tax=Gordonia sp. (in: high G+C Gram-positive bacteria) TaxID=84139 RepID=UPI003528CF8E
MSAEAVSGADRGLRVAAVISAYEPDQALAETVDAVIGQVDRVVIVDDGSPSLTGQDPGPVRALLDACRARGAEVIESPQNSGIAQALNRGLDEVLADGADLVLTLDQDTVVTPDFMVRMVAHHRLVTSLGIADFLLSPSAINGRPAPFWFAERGLTLAFEPIQSGMVIPRSLFEKIGTFDEGLFIDCVDTEFYLRARAAGAHAFVAPGAGITHRLGGASEWRPPRPVRRMLGRRNRSYRISEDAPFRHFYIARNRLRLYRRYGRSEPLWTAVSVGKDTFFRGRAMLLGSDRLARTRFTAAGLSAGLRGATGRIPPAVTERVRGGEYARLTEAARRMQPRIPAQVSVVIPARDAVGTIDTQLSALAAQDYADPFEVVVCDNASGDGLAGHLSAHPLAERLNLRVADAAERVGASYTRNVGAAAAYGDLLVFCDADDAAHPDWLRELVATARWYDLVSGGVETDSLNSATVRQWRPMPPADRPFAIPGFMRVVTGCNMAIWKEAFDRVGGFRETYASGYEDADLALRLQLQGGSVGHCPEALMAYRLRGTLGGLWSQSVTYGVGLVQLYDEYRGHGMPRMPLLAPIDTGLYLLLRNPLLPTAITRVPTGRWVFQAACLTGRIKGSLRYRHWFV